MRGIGEGVRKRGRCWSTKLPSLAALALVTALFGATPLQAQVQEIGPDGRVVTISGPAVYLTDDLRPQSIRPTTLPEYRARVAQNRPKRPALAIESVIAAASAHYSVSPILVTAVAWRESDFDTAALSPKGARGVMQLMPDTARALNADARIPSANIDAGVAYLALLLRHYDGDIIKALAAYNAGPRAVDHYGGMPPYRETRAYVDAILDRMSVASTDQSLQEDLP